MKDATNIRNAETARILVTHAIDAAHEPAFVAWAAAYLDGQERACSVETIAFELRSALNHLHHTQDSILALKAALRVARGRPGR